MMQQIPNPARRKWLQAATLTPLISGGAALSASPNEAKAAFPTLAKIVIMGSGLGGVAVANRLHRELDGADITIIDAKVEHNYQPGYTLVATGVWPITKVRNQNADYHPVGVKWLQDMVIAVDPDANTVTTLGGQKIQYDFLVVATGVHLDYNQIEGMEVDAIGQNGMTSVYASPKAALATWEAMQTFTQKGGDAVMTLPGTPIKCAGAPLKMTFMLRDRLKRAGTLEQSNIQFQSAFNNVFGVRVVNENVLERWKKLSVGVNYQRTMTGIDIGARKATFAQASGESITLPYDFIHVVPPQRAPDVIKNSPLAWQTGSMAAGGWLEVSQETLQHKRYKNVFGVGDVNGTPRGKTAATVKKSAPIVVNNLIEVIKGNEPNMTFDGYTSCPLITREGAAMLIEFDYAGNLTPTLPVIEPLKASYFAWIMKVGMLKPAYVAVLKGRV
jgi:sulfide:quinone oxidoreductase